MIGFYINLYPTIISFIVSLVLLFYIIAHPFAKISFSAHHYYYISFAIANIIRSIGIFLGDKYCVSYGFYLFIGGFLYLSYVALIHSLTFIESIKTGTLAIVYEHFGKHFVVIHAALIIQMTLAVYFDDKVTSENYCIYNFQSLEFDIFVEPLIYIVVYPLIIAWSLVVCILFYGAFTLNFSHLSSIVRPVVIRLRYYILLIEMCIVPAILFLITNPFFENVNYLWKIFLVNQSICTTVYQLDYFLHMNPLFNRTLFLQGRKLHQQKLTSGQVQQVEGTSTLQSTSSSLGRQLCLHWLHFLFIKWDRLMYNSSRDTTVSDISSELLPSESMVPSEYFRESDQRM